MPLSKNYELGTLANTLDIDQSTGEITSLTIDTDVVSEGANLYFTSERVDDRVAALIQAGTNITVAYDDVLGTLTISASDTEDDLSNNTTSDLAEGTNLYYTNARADARIAAASIDALSDVDITTAAPSSGQSLVWDNVNSKFIPGDSFSQSDFDTAFAAKSTTNLSEGTNLYYTDARADARIAAATTTDLTEGTNLYYTDARADARAQLKIDALVDSAPNTLDTLNELASALGDDANFSTTITNSIATKLATADFNSTFDTRLGTKTTANLTEGTNLYFTNARADARIALQAGANLDLSSKSTSDLSEGTNLYYTNARVDAHLNQSNPTSGYVLSWNGSDYAWIDNTGYTAFNTDFDTRLGTKTTADLTEGSNLYYTNARADARVDAGFTAKSTSDLSEGTNLYYTNARADARIALQVGANLDLSSKDTNSLSEGSNNLYYTDARADARVNLQTGSNLNLSSKDTDDLSEGSNNLYFTNARVQGTTINAGSLRGSVNNATVQYGTSYSGTPAQGSFFFDSLNAKLKVYNGSAFVDAVPAGGGGGSGSGSSDANATFRKYTFDISSTTNSVSGKDSVVVTAGSFVTGYQYQIISVGNTDFTAIGASGNTVGVTFTATGVGTGTGTAGHVLNYATSNQNVEVYRNGAKMVEGSGDDYVATTGTSVNFTYNLQSGDVVEVQVYELLTNDAYYLKTETYTQTETNSQISTAVAGYLPLSGGVLTDDLAINNGSPELYFGTTGNHYNWRIAAQEAVDAAFEISVGSQDTDYSNDTYTPKLVVKSGGSVGIGTNGPESNLHVRSAAVSGKHLDSNIDLLIEGTDTRLQVMASDGGANGSVMLLSTEDHHWIHHAHATSASNMYSLGYYNSSGSGFDGAAQSNEALNITTAGNVSIGGTLSPGAALVVDGSGGQDTSGSTMVLYDNRTTAADVGGSIMFSFDWNGTNGHLGSGPFIKGYKVNASTSDYSSGLKFGTRKNGVGNNAIAMTIDEDQNVGIGTTNPDYTLVVGNNSTYHTLKVQGVDANLAATVKFKHHGGSGRTGIDPEWNISRGSNQTSFNTGVTSGNALVGGLAFWNNTIGGGNVDAMRLKDNGDAIFGYNVGIGTVNPGTTLHVYNSTANGVATFESGDAQGGIALKDNSTTQPVYLLADGNDFKVQTNTAEVMRIHSEGYTELKSSDAYNQLVLTPSGTNAPASINFNTPGTGRAKIKVQDTEFISILSTGNVGIGTSSPVATLQITPPNEHQNSFRIYRGGSSGYELNYLNMSLYLGNTVFNTTSTDSSGKRYLFQINGTEKFRIDQNGEVGIGTTSPKKLLHLYGDENAGGLGIAIQDDGWGAPNGLFMTTVRNSDGAYTIRKNTATAMDFSTYTDMLSVEGNGDVGIGTANASYRLDVQGGKIRHRGATATGSGNLVMPSNSNFQTYAQENGFQIAAENGGDWASHLILTNVPASGNNKHWVIHHAPTTNNTSYKQDSLVFTFQNTSAVAEIGGDGAGTTSLAMQSNGSVKVNGSAVGENFGVNGRAKFHGADYQQIKLQSLTNQGWAGLQFSDIVSASDGNSGLADTSQLGFLRFCHGDGLNQTVSGQTANAGYVFGSSENVNVISFQHNMSTTSYGTNAGEIRFGSGVSTTYGTSSDRRIKENIATLASGSSKTKILAMNPVTYNLINDPNETPIEHTGFIAQEMHEIMPEIVQGHGLTDRETGEDTIMSIDYSKLTPVLVGALQDALAEIETLKARLDAAGIE